MKRLLQAGIVTFGLLSLFTFLVSLVQVRDLYMKAAADAGPPLDYHFALYLPDNRNSFFNGIIRGAQEAAEAYSSGISIHSIDPLKNELELASYTGIDGAIVCPYLDDATARRQLSKLGARDIPVVIINHNVPNDQPWPFIGTNNFDVGRRMGNIAGGVNEGPIFPAIVYSDKSPGIFGERELVEMGITSALGARLGAPITGLRTNLNPLDAEGLLYRLFRSGTPVNTIIFTDANDTIAAAQALIEMNLVGQVQIIGFGDDEPILENIRKGIVAGSIAVNPERIGFEAFRSLMALRTTGYTSTSIDTGIKVIDRDSL